jgi:hypothetical protein
MDGSLSHARAIPGSSTRHWPTPGRVAERIRREPAGKRRITRAPLRSSLREPATICADRRSYHGFVAQQGAAISPDFSFARCQKDLTKLDASATAALSGPVGRHPRKATVSRRDECSSALFAPISRRSCVALAERFGQPVKECSDPHPLAKGGLAARSCASSPGSPS